MRADLATPPRMALTARPLVEGILRGTSYMGMERVHEQFSAAIAQSSQFFWLATTENRRAAAAATPELTAE